VLESLFEFCLGEVASESSDEDGTAVFAVVGSQDDFVFPDLS
jgi:hypothetical protein